MKKSFCNTGLALAAVAAMVAISACSSSDAENIVENILPSTNVRAIHLSPDTPDVDVEYMLIEAQDTITGLSYKEASPYTDISTGTTQVVLKRSSDGEEIATYDDVYFDNDADHTVYMVNFLSNLEFIDSDDDRSADTGVAKIRFVHASPDAPAQVDLKTDGPNGTAVFSGVGFKDISDYTTVTPGEHTFVVTVAGDTSDALATFAPVTLNGGTVYTIVALGTVNETDTYDFGVRVFNDTDADGDGFVDLTID